MRVPEQMNCSRMATPCRETCAGNSPGAASLPPRIRPVGSDPDWRSPALAWGRKPALAWERDRMTRRRLADMAATDQIAAADPLSRK